MEIERAMLGLGMLEFVAMLRAKPPVLDPLLPKLASGAGRPATDDPDIGAAASRSTVATAPLGARREPGASAAGPGGVGVERTAEALPPGQSMMLAKFAGNSCAERPEHRRSAAACLHPLPPLPRKRPRL